MKHLWEIKHPYYLSDSNWYSNEARICFQSWDDFIAEWGDADKDYNLLFRWDWTVYDKDDVDPGDNHSVLLLGYMLQRKGKYVPIVIENPDKSREDEIRAFLQERLDYLLTVWEM